MSRFPDAVRGRRRGQKGMIAEEPEALMLLDSGHIVKNYMAVIVRWRATQDMIHDIDGFSGRLSSRPFVVRCAQEETLLIRV